MATFDLAPEFGLVSASDTYVSTSPAWCIAVIRYKNQITFNRATQKSFSNNGADAVAEDGPPLIITSDCISLQVHSDKNNFTSNMTAVLMPGTVNYLSIKPGDWVFAWMMNQEDQLQGLIDNINARQPCNDWTSGLKFVGKAYGVRKNISISPGGVKNIRYNLQCHGFTEFNNQVFWDPAFAQDFDLINWMGRLNVAIQDFFDGKTIDSNKAVPTLLKYLLGTGIPTKASQITDSGGNTQTIIAGATAGEGEGAYVAVIPASAGAWLNKLGTSKSSQVLAYSDILEAIFGVQTYTNQSPQQLKPSTIFLPDGTENIIGQRATPLPLLGKFLISMPNFNGSSTWSILNTYVNPLVNEMYTTLRVNALNQIQPTLILRQIPLSSDEIIDGIGYSPDSDTDGPSNYTLSRFLDLPRWKIPNQVISFASVGTSDSQRFNYIHMTAESLSQQYAAQAKIGLVLNKPILDEQDVRRNGLRMARGSIATSPTDIKAGPSKWMKIKSDIVMGMQLTLTGTLVSKGIQAPIAIGDNLEFDGAVFHIESVTHSSSIAGGTKSFTTELGLTFGVRDRINNTGGITKFEEDLTSNDPGFTVDGVKEHPVGDFPTNSSTTRIA